MAHDVTSWFMQQLETHASEPKRIFTVNGSDYSERVDRWPTIKFNNHGMQSVKLTVPLVNADGAFNTFHENTYTMPGTCMLDFGFTHPTSGDEMIRMYTGEIKQVKYTDKKCNLYLRDRLWRFTDREIGESSAPVIFSSQIPSDIAWTLCTCYGELSIVQSDSNTDIEWDSYQEWAAQFSADNVQIEARYDGQKIVKALKSLADMTDSVIWADGYGKINFRRYSEPSSTDFIITRDEQMELIIDVDDLAVVNKQWVSMDYSPQSRYWANSVYSVETTSVNTYGLREDTLQDETIWYVDSVSALNMANRKTTLLQYPPKRFEIDTLLMGIHRELGETLRLVDSFYNITSASGWRFTSMEINTDTGQTKYGIDEATVMNGFYLDVHNLDGDEFLL